MQSLRLKVFNDFGVEARGKGSGCPNNPTGLLGFEVGSRKNWACSMVNGNGVRFCKIVACSSQRNAGSGSPSPSSGLGGHVSRPETYAMLKQQMEVAAKAEDYKEAARIRDSLRSFEEEEPILRLKKLLKEAIAEERFQADAARYRDGLQEISPHSLLKCSSDATTLGIRVQVRSVYIEGRSEPSKGQYFFAYRIRITNNSDRPVQLLRRHWIITDANGKTENLWGIGVIGEQPEGEYEMEHIDRAGSRPFNAVIAPFSLSTLDEDGDPF
ncbi:hypothetical protein Cgig2_012731 [Carnegiea gigantea]|uniref:Uncharacterized protein n=1 Tax=Carnegiea gigantea TaxID=171969 RepID=A0A9Q1QH72_9CARY|nr:hypothetical protein Cgig2_012731 [Carnegiea gigantea]